MAGKSLPGLVIKIGANTKDAIDGLNKVNRAIGNSGGGMNKMNAMLSKAGPAFAAAAAGAGLLAIKMGTDAVQAAMDEQRELARLNTTLGNLGFGAASDEVSTFIDNLQFSANVADSDLRPAFETLVRATGDVREAQDALALSVDIAAGTGRDLGQVTKALARGFGGNTQALGRLGAGLDKATLKSGDMLAITGQLRDTFGGQASAQADTLYGSVKGVQIAWDELVESFGNGITGTGDAGAKTMQDLEKRLRDAQPQAQQLGNDVQNIGLASLDVYDNFRSMGQALGSGNWDLVRRMIFATNEELRTLNKEAMSAGKQFEYVQYAAYDTSDGYRAATTGLIAYKTAAEDTTRANDMQVASLKRLQGQLDKLAGKRNIMGQRLSIAQLLAQGPSKSGANGKTSTVADRKDFALNVADAYGGLASDLLATGKRGQARSQLAAARQAIRGMNLPDAFQSNLLSTLRTPSGLQARPAAMAGTPQTGRDVAMVNYNFYGGINVDSNEAAQQAAKEARRLASLSGDRYAGMAATGRGFRR